MIELKRFSLLGFGAWVIIALGFGVGQSVDAVIGLQMFGIAESFIFGTIMGALYGGIPAFLLVTAATVLGVVE